MRGALLRSDGRARNGLTRPGRSVLRCYRRGLRVAPVVARVVNDVICHRSTRGIAPCERKRQRRSRRLFSGHFNEHQACADARVQRSGRLDNAKIAVDPHIQPDQRYQRAGKIRRFSYQRTHSAPALCYLMDANCSPYAHCYQG